MINLSIKQTNSYSPKLTFSDKNKTMTFKSNHFPIRDLGSESFDILQKQKVNLLIRYREAKFLRASMEIKSQQATSNNFGKTLSEKIRKELTEAKQYEKEIGEKLHSVNLSLLAEEEKNY